MVIVCVNVMIGERKIMINYNFVIGSFFNVKFFDMINNDEDKEKEEYVICKLYLK